MMTSKQSTEIHSLNFNLVQGDLFKEQGIDLAAESRKKMLEFARDKARFVALQRDSRTVSIDDVFYQLEEADIPACALGMAAGAVFRTDDWEHVGYTRSTRVSNHARPITLWRLK